MNTPLISKTELESPQLVELYEYWNRLRGTRIAPALREVDPREMSQLLPWVWLADVVDGGDDFGFRLGGEKVIEYVGRRLSGAKLNHFRGQHFFETMRDTFAFCMKTKGPVVRRPGRSTLKARGFEDIQVLLLPLSSDGVRVTQLIGGLAYVAEQQRKSA